ncbi:CinA family protein [uncultured Sphingopyxis sp.]|nr:CinA family protein [uncultured Sphingopyxis sp.]
MEAGRRALVAALRKTDLRIAVAESCTGGQLAALLARDVELGPHLDRGFVVYSAGSKHQLLGVHREDVDRCDAVNPEVAEGLARGALARSDADLAVGITGFCGPQQDDEEVGLVHLACAARGGAFRAQECHFGAIGRDRVLDMAVAAGLALLAEIAGDLAMPALAVDQKRQPRVSWLSRSAPSE